MGTGRQQSIVCVERLVYLRFRDEAAYHNKVRSLVCLAKLRVQRCFDGMVVWVVCCPRALVFGVLLQEVLQLCLLGLRLHEFQTVIDLQLCTLFAVYHDVAILVEFVQLALLLWCEFNLRWVGIVPLLPLQGSALACLRIGKCHRRTECIVLKGLHVAIYWHKLAVGQRLQLHCLRIILIKQTELRLVFFRLSKFVVLGIEFFLLGNGFIKFFLLGEWRITLRHGLQHFAVGVILAMVHLIVMDDLLQQTAEYKTCLCRVLWHSLCVTDAPCVVSSKLHLVV